MTVPTLRTNLWKGALVVGLAAFAGYLALSGRASQDIVAQAIGVAAVAAILIGVRLNRPDDRTSWYLLAAGMFGFVCGDSLENVSGLGLRASHQHPTVANALYLAGYLFLILAVSRLGRTRNRTVRREDYLDAAIVTLGVLAISWDLVINRYADNGSLSWDGKIVLLAYLAMDLVLVFTVFEALLFQRGGRPFHRLLAGGLLVMVATDFGHAFLAQRGQGTNANLCNAGLVLAYALIAAAALHPSVGEVVAGETTAKPNIYRREPTSPHRTPVVTCAAAIPPTVLLVSSALGTSVNVVAMSALCVTAFGLIYLRMIWMIGRITRQSDEIEMHAHELEASHRQRDALEADLRHLAFHDELTGLANRALLHDRVEHALASMPRSGRSVALCFGDLDGFKTVNDTLGHKVGDNVLVRASRLLSSIVRPGDTVARLGGDEFAVLMVDVQDPQDAVDFAHRIVAVLQNAPDFEGHQVDLSISVGVAYADADKTTEQLLSEADAAMYEAKEKGKNCVEVFRSSMRAKMLERLDLTNGFRWALGRSEFYLQYQPIISLSDNQLQGFEALVRWSHPTLGEVAPLRFIPIAEETGFIAPLGRWVLVEACEQLSAWCADAGERISLSVNLSKRQLISPHLADEVEHALSASGVDPRQLILEITESVLMDDPDRSVLALAELREMGIRIAVDDFGAGYSSLSHLQRLPVDILKIDKSFVDPLVGSSSDGSALVAAIVGLADTLGLQVIAEGIEHQSQLHRLVDLGCMQGQGFLLAPPLDRDETEALIKRLTTGVPVS